MLKASFSGKYIEAGLDEVGRGCLAGPVVAAAVILPPDFEDTRLKDSKQIKASLREELADMIQKESLDWAIAEASPEEIDAINIAQASYLAMHRALDQLSLRPELLLVDGKYFSPYQFTPYHCIIKGDNTYYSIAAASVLAKVQRDRFMAKIAQDYPHYDWENNMGYPTKKHRAALQKHGASPWHRKSFKWKAPPK